MSSKPADATTQAAASTGAQTNDATLDANAAENQTFANNSRSSLFGTYNPSTNSYSGGTESQFLDPSSLNTTGLTGSYSNLYNSQANQTAQGAQQAVGTTIQNLQSRGMGAAPAGFAADQQRQAFQNQANQNSTNYATDFGNQHQEAVSQYNLANNLLSNNSTGAGTLSGSENGTAAGNYAGLYGTATTPTPTALGTVLGAAGTLAGAGASAYKTYSQP